MKYIYINKYIADIYAFMIVDINFILNNKRFPFKNVCSFTSFNDIYHIKNSFLSSIIMLLVI